MIKTFTAGAEAAESDYFSFAFLSKANEKKSFLCALCLSGRSFSEAWRLCGEKDFSEYVTIIMNKSTKRIHALKIPFKIPVSPEMAVDRFASVYLILGDKIHLIDSGVAGAEAAIWEYIKEPNRIDLQARINRQKAELKFGNHRNAELLREWKSFGESSFEFEVLDELAHDENYKANHAQGLRILTNMWIRKLENSGSSVVRL